MKSPTEGKGIKEIIKLFREFLKWRENEWKARIKFTEKQNRDLEKRHMVGGWTPAEIDDGIEEFVGWLELKLKGKL